MMERCLWAIGKERWWVWVIREAEEGWGDMWWSLVVWCSKPVYYISPELRPDIVLVFSIPIFRLSRHRLEVPLMERGEVASRRLMMVGLTSIPAGPPLCRQPTKGTLGLLLKLGDLSWKWIIRFIKSEATSRTAAQLCHVLYVSHKEYLWRNGIHMGRSLLVSTSCWRTALGICLQRSDLARFRPWLLIYSVEPLSREGVIRRRFSIKWMVLWFAFFPPKEWGLLPSPWCEALCSRNKQEYRSLAWILPWRKETDDIIVGVVWTS